MLHIDETGSELQVRYSHYLLPVVLLLIPPLLLIEHGGSIIDGSISRGDLAGLSIGFVVPLLCAYFFVEFGQFSFRKDRDLFAWRWRNLVRRESGEVPLRRVVRIRREGMESSDLIGWQNCYRLVAVLDDDTIIGLTRGYSGMHDRKLDAIVEQIRDYLGHAN